MHDIDRINRRHILVIERSNLEGWRTEPLLDPAVYAVETLQTIDSALTRLQRAPSPDAVLLNMTPSGIGPECIETLRRVRPYLNIIAVVPEKDVEMVWTAARMGAAVCAWKPRDEQTLQDSIENSMRNSDAAPISELPDDVEELSGGGFFVMASPQMRKLRGQVTQVAGINVPLLILGESGTGKEVIARLVHKLSPRAQRPFLKVNCAAVPGELLESELFGYERGAFTGAVRSKLGTFEAANHGTLLLDEIAEMPPALQAKLLHVLQDQEFSRLGSCNRIRVNIRILAATNIDIREAIAAKSFREDLYYRLSAFVFSIAPLRERRQDIPILLQRYMAHYADRLRLPMRPLSKQLWESCLLYAWPGNVRELENFAKRYLICGEERIALDLSAPTVAVRRIDGFGDLKAHLRHTRDSEEAAIISHALEETNWNRKEAAKRLSISYKSILLKIKQYGLDQVTEKTLSKYLTPGPLHMSGSGSEI